jgi:MFS transporter, AAHS family, benzoate transport protein
MTSWVATCVTEENEESHEGESASTASWCCVYESRPTVPEMSATELVNGPSDPAGGGIVATWRALSPGARIVLVICGAAIFVDAYDLIVYGAVVPALLADRSWGLSATEVGAIASWTLAGQLVGALFAGILTDWIGRRRLIIGGVAWFSVGMVLCALAPSAISFTALRFIVGLGLGVVMPTASALTLEYAPAGRRKMTYAMMFGGYAVGAFCAAALASVALADLGWRFMFWISAVPALLLVPAALIWLPESPGYLLRSGREAAARALAARHAVDLGEPSVDGERPTSRWSSLETLFSRRYLVATVLFWMASFAALLLIFGLQTWLPQLMRTAGYDLGSAVLFLGVLNGGALVGTLFAARIADQLGCRTVVVTSFLIAAGAIALLAARPQSGLTYVLIALAGLGTIGTQILINAFVGDHYPADTRASALGWALGIGRLGAIVGPTLTGWLIDSEVGFRWNFYVFAVVALAGALIAAGVPRRTPSTHADASSATALTSDRRERLAYARKDRV